jgi:hypothetical protein
MLPAADTVLTHARKKRKPYEGIPWLKIMMALEVIILLVLLFHGIAGVITKSGLSKEKSEYMVSSYAGIDGDIELNRFP